MKKYLFKLVSIFTTCFLWLYCQAQTDPCANIATLSCGTQTTVTLAGTGVWNNATCGLSNPGQENMYSYTPTTTGVHSIQVTSVSSTGYIDYQYKQASGGCTSTGWTCIDEISNSGTFPIGTLTAGVQYYILLDAESTNSGTQTFRVLCPGLVVDPCANMATLSCATPTTITLAGTGVWNNATCGFSTPGQENMYSFTPTTTGVHSIQVTSVGATGFIDYQYKAASGGCSSTGWTCISDISNSGTFPIGSLTAGVQYYILLDAESPSSNTQKFRVICPAPLPSCIGASPTSPTNGQSLCPMAQTTLSWPTVAGATSYDIYFGTSNTPPFVSNTTSNSYAASTSTSGTYYWQVVPKNASGAATGCSVWNFTASYLNWYKDTDNDGYSDGAQETQCAQPTGYKLAADLTAIRGDCNDDPANGGAAVNPGITEICDGIDNDCDGLTDEGVKTTWYLDADGDGYYTRSTQSCTSPGPGYTTTGLPGDCNDNPANGGAAINPGAREVCNGIDDDCNGTTDEGCARTWYFDYDRDGYGNRNKPLVSVTKPWKYVDNGDDCMDWLATVHPKADELPDNIDNDCDGEVDEGLDCRKKWYFDKDRDGYGNPNVPFRWSCIPMDEYIDNNLDCRDWDASVNPGKAEICGDGKDNNCNGLIDEGCVVVGIDNGKQPEVIKPLAMATADAGGLGIRLWPNPARDVLMVTLDAFVPNQKLELTLMQADGKVQTAQSVLPTVKGQQVRMDVSRSAAGLYLLQVKQGLISETRRVIIIR